MNGTRTNIFGSWVLIAAEHLNRAKADRNKDATGYKFVQPAVVLRTKYAKA